MRGRLGKRAVGSMRISDMLPTITDAEIDAITEAHAEAARGGLRLASPVTDAYIDAVTEAYVRERWPNVAEWRKAYPAAYSETRERIRIALEAAVRVRES